MKIKVISFDLQGTISKSGFSDEFWMELIPELYAKKFKIPLIKAKSILKERFEEYGKYDYRYYSPEYWIQELCPEYTVWDLIKMIRIEKAFIPQTLELMEKLVKNYPLIITSSTTKAFITYELACYETYFKHKFSSLEDFGIAGKPPEVYSVIAEKLAIKPEEILHIGDSNEMDVINARKAGVSAVLFSNSMKSADLAAEIAKYLI